MTAYFVDVIDRQRGIKWKKDLTALDPLIKSVTKHGQKLLIFNNFGYDHIYQNIEWKHTHKIVDPYFGRWAEYYQHLLDNPGIDNVFCVDATDVEMLNNPFQHFKQGELYVGDEKKVVGIPWMFEKHKNGFLVKFIRGNKDRKLLNAGIIGGSSYDIREFSRRMNQLFILNDHDLGIGDLGAFNYVCYNEYADKLITGEMINTEFKKFDTENKVAWWRHK